MLDTILNNFFFTIGGTDFLYMVAGVFLTYIITISANVTDLIGDFSVIVTLIIGIILALFVLQVIIDIIRK